MALMAALLQALIAIALVGAAGFIFQATALQMTNAADWINLASYCSVAAIGAWLVWRKGSALFAALSEREERRRALASTPAYFGVRWRRPAFSLSAAAYRAGPPEGAGVFADGCGHAHAPDPAELDGSSLTGSVPVITTRAPFWRNSSAVARPIPLFPPVITAILFSNNMFFPCAIDNSR